MGIVLRGEIIFIISRFGLKGLWTGLFKIYLRGFHHVSGWCTCSKSISIVFHKLFVMKRVVNTLEEPSIWKIMKQNRIKFGI